ncbi:MAG: bifunctional DNA-formamidopyrimidine glycosylase/DNA-(apurinic or apyrimidinic site) lyase [Planctomycetes bacterium]|nr:bifunctional DNA-formamidopyrimidine glycosylase/DNA-(apurinic or apyrimidinic site) lyase [Planctomycetota bacterium]
MPELPEVETTRRGLAATLLGRRIDRVDVRERRLRWPVTPGLPRVLEGGTVRSVDRRAKYLLISVDHDDGAHGTLIVHLGMSGSLRWEPVGAPLRVHDHLEFRVGRRVLRYHDPRRFGAVLWTSASPERHRLLVGLGPEPFDPAFDGRYLYERSRGRRIALRDFLLDGRQVVGVGNIYASEAAHRAGIHPGRAAGTISSRRFDALVDAIREVLDEAIRAGGTTLRDYRGSDGAEGEFQLRLRVYGREGEPCPQCAAPVRRRVSGQRSYFYCPKCQRF